MYNIKSKTPPNSNIYHYKSNIRKTSIKLKCTKEQRSIPRSPKETAEQVISATKAAYNDGIQNQMIQMLIPIIGATELDDWPGGIKQMFNAILPMVEMILINIKKIESLKGKLDARIIEESDAVAAWIGDNLACIVFPNATSLNKIKEIFKDKKLRILINPQWSEKGQVVSDFGFGKQRRENEEYVKGFEYVYKLKQYRIKSIDVKVLKCYPENWKVFVLDELDNLNLIADLENEPKYLDIQNLIEENDENPKSLIDRMKKEFDFNYKTLNANLDE